MPPSVVHSSQRPTPPSAASVGTKYEITMSGMAIMSPLGITRCGCSTSPASTDIES